MTHRTLAPILFLAIPLPAQQTQPPRPTAAPQSATVVSPEPLPLNAPDAADRSVQSFDLTDPRTAPLYASAVDYLRLDPSLTLQERSPAGVQADLSIRGTTFEQTLVLVDGLRVNDPETGHLNMDLAIPLEAISRIDVLHGSGSTFFGSDAIGGAVNLITAAPTHGSATLQVGGGNLHSTAQHLRLSEVSAKIAMTLTAARDTSDGFFYQGQNDRGYHANVLSLDTFETLTAKLAPAEILLGASDRPYGANLFYGDYDSSERTKGWFAAIRQPLPAGLFADFAYRKHTDLFVLFAGQPSLYENNHIDSAWQTDLRRDTPFAHGKFDLAYGLEADGDAIRSTNLGMHARNQGAGYASLSLHSLRRLTLSVGARQEIFAGPTAVFSPAASAGFYLGNGFRLHAAAGRGFRLPTYVDLYYSDPTTIGNPNLKPETSQSYEGGVEWIPPLGSTAGHSRFKLNATGFTLRQTNAIDYSKDSVAAPYQATNVGHIAYSGLEASLSYRLAGTQQLDLGETYLHAGPPPAGLISEYAYNYASHNASLAYRATFARPQLALRSQLSIIQQTGRTAYPLLSLDLTRTRGAIRPYVRIQDLANISYEELPNIPQPGRTEMAGIVFTWPRK
jgi:iron complex outermembrane receptor protein